MDPYLPPRARAPRCLLGLVARLSLRPLLRQGDMGHHENTEPVSHGSVN